MNLVYSSYATPFSAFFEGMVRVYDWGSLIPSLRNRERRFQMEDGDPDRRTRIVDRYVRDAIAAFESEEAERLTDLPLVHRRASAAADIVLGSLPADEVLIQYEGIVPGAVNRIMGRASERLGRDSDTEVRYLEDLCRQGFRGMVAGFILIMLLSGIALFLIYSGSLAEGLALVGVNLAIGLCATYYVSKTRLRRRWFTGEFFPRVFTRKSKFTTVRSERQRRPVV